MTESIDSKVDISTFDLYKFGNIFMNSLLISQNNICVEHIFLLLYTIPQSIVYSLVSYTLIYIMCIYIHINIYYYVSKTLLYSMNLLLSTIYIEMYIDNVNLT